MNKPAPATAEWTAERLMSCVSFEEEAAAINAAIAAERENTKAAVEELKTIAQWDEYAAEVLSRIGEGK